MIDMQTVLYVESFFQKMILYPSELFPSIIRFALFNIVE